MAKIIPFQGYCPPPDIACKISSPPYDVMTSDEARGMVRYNPNSFLRIIKPEIDFTPSDEPRGKSLHEHGLDNLQAFINNGNLVRDENPCFYIYQIKMGPHIQTGVVAAVSVKEYNQGLIKKHEFTRPKKENDRTQHIEIMNANTGPVFLTFRNDGQFQNKVTKIKKQSPDVSFTADDDTIHSLWKIDFMDDINLLIKYFNTISTLYIADGHHRAASASRVMKIRQTANPNHSGDELYNYFLAVIFPHDEMQILAYNRVVKDLNGLTEEQLLDSIKTNFIITSKPSLLEPPLQYTYSMFLNERWYNLEAKAHIISKDPVEGLGASILQNYILNPILGIDDPRTDNRIDFVGGIRGLEELEYRCKIDSKVAFALHPVSIEDLLAVADAKKVMPPKSTWFEPKLRSGLVVRLLD